MMGNKKVKRGNMKGTAENNWGKWESRMVMTVNRKEKWESRKERWGNKREMLDCKYRGRWRIRWRCRRVGRGSRRIGRGCG